MSEDKMAMTPKKLEAILGEGVLESHAPLVCFVACVVPIVFSSICIVSTVPSP